MSLFYKTRTDSLLSKQHPSRIKKKTKKTFFLNCLLSIFLGLLLLNSHKFLKKISALNFQKEKGPYTFYIDESFSNEEKLKINTKLEMDLSKKVELDEISINLVKELNLANIQINLLGFKTISIKGQKREPIMAIVLGEGKKIISQDGSVYSTHGNDPTQELTELKGVLQRDKKEIVYKEDNTIQTTKEEDFLIKEAVKLYQALEKKKEVKEILFTEYRGFQIKLVRPDILVEFGREPFEKKISRLDDLINSNKLEIQNIQSIELDFTNKAFIKNHKG